MSTLRAALALLACFALAPTMVPPRARAEGPLLARLDPGGLSSLSGIPQPAPQRGAALTVSETARADAWILGMHEARSRRERAEKWAVPLLFGAAAVIGAGSAVLGESDAARITFAGSALVAGAGMGLSFFVEPEHRGPLFVLGGSAFATTFGAGVITDAYKHESCAGYCFNERALGWLGAGLVAEALTFIPLAFVDRGPTKLELSAYTRLPVEERPHAARMILSRIDRAERKALAVSLAMQLATLAVLATGAAVVRDDSQQVPLFALGGATFGIASITTLAALLKKSRLEKFVEGGRPDAVERVFW